MERRGLEREGLKGEGLKGEGCKGEGWKEECWWGECQWRALVGRVDNWEISIFLISLAETDLLHPLLRRNSSTIPLVVNVAIGLSAV